MILAINRTNLLNSNSDNNSTSCNTITGKQLKFLF